jgi:hypothetical protein
MAGASQIRACLFGASLFLPCVANGSTSVDICQEPVAESHLAIAYYDQENSSFESDRGVTNRVNYSTDLLLAASKKWILGFGHRSTILNVDNQELQTNGYLHTFFFPVHRTSHSDSRSFRISIAPALSGSSNVIKDPDEYTKDAIQLLAAMVWSRRVSDQLGLSYGICGDYRLGGYQVYPVISFNWQPHPDWKIELGFPTSQLSYEVTKSFNFLLSVSPNGNEWYVKNKSLEKDSKLVYEAYVLELAFNWRLHQRFMFTASVGREFDGRYEMTLLDDSRVRLSIDSATRFGVALAWFF